MDLRKVRKLIELFHESELTELQIREGEESIRLSRKSKDSEPVYVHQPYGGVAPVPIPAEPAGSADQPPEQAADEVPDGHAVRSPMVGTFFRSASPSEPAFVEVGDQVVEGQTLCLIEAMKIFNQIESERSGTVVRILKDDGEPVEYGETLFLIIE